ncbi:hypothetical protein LAZ67_4002857 [Cordylochernes scorpioides]|uniref:Uncharacterized protein n=1 Tax=Cordylochernes scorpioides TaxID=51811 RepID=A0ABY6KE71_9ARAC|nr:hypothetical protein LAZ67_4002857 [Cordylochernes scorpioides]
MDSNSKLTKISSIEVSTRPEIAYAVSALGQFSNDPRRQHWNAAKRVLRYLKGTSCLRITYRKSNEALHGYVDADWGGNLVDGKSHTGIVYFLARGPIAWESKKQQTVTLSSTESEYIALCEAGKEAVYLRALLDEMGFGELLNGPTVLKTDNQGAQQLARNPVNHARTKHIDIKWHYIRSICSDGLVEVIHTPTQENVADILTKGLPRKVTSNTFLGIENLIEDEDITLSQYIYIDKILDKFKMSDCNASFVPGTIGEILDDLKDSKKFSPQIYQETIGSLMYLSTELNMKQLIKEPTTIKTDSKSLIDWINNQKKTTRTRHFNRKYHFIKDEYVKKTIQPIFVRTEQQEADLLTKNLSGPRLKNQTKMLGMDMDLTQD